MGNQEPDDMAARDGLLRSVSSRVIAPPRHRQHCMANLVVAATALAIILIAFLAWAPAKNHVVENDSSTLFEAGSGYEEVVKRNGNEFLGSTGSDIFESVATEIVKKASEMLFEVSKEDYVNVTVEKNLTSNVKGTKPKCEVLFGRKEGDWVKLLCEDGYMKITDADDQAQLRKVDVFFELMNGTCTDGKFAITEPTMCKAAATRLGFDNTTFAVTEEMPGIEGCYLPKSTGSGTTDSTPQQICSTEDRCKPMTTTLTTTLCLQCTPKSRIQPEIVIPVFERDLCKLKYTARSISAFDPHHLLSDVRILWVSNNPPSMYQAALEEVKNEIKKSRLVHFHDFSGQMNSINIAGWFAQMIVKLKVASVVTSEYYLVLDAKNTFIKELDSTTFFSDCNQAIIPAFYRYDQIPEPHSQWYAKAAQTFQVSPPYEAYFPASITPAILHKQTVLDMLNYIGEDPNLFGSLCKGTLCQHLGVFSATGKEGSSEFTMYTMFAYTKTNLKCIHDVDLRNFTEQWAGSLWRGEPSNQASTMEANLNSLAWTMSGKGTSLMFGSQPRALDFMSNEQRAKAVEDLVQIYKNAKLYDSSTSPDEFVTCIVGQ